MGEYLTVVHSTPVLESLNSSGRKKFWQAFVAEFAEGIIHYTTSWQELASGGLSRKNRSEFTTVTGKNLGRSNETSPLEQAISEVNSLMSKKWDEGYHEVGKTRGTLPLPMLAHKFSDRGKSITYPCFVQPKFDGHRALYDGQKFWTRKGKLYLPEAVKHLHFDTQGCIVDGEIMLAPGNTFQETTSAIKKFGKNSPKLHYYVFDILLANTPFSERADRLKDILKYESEDSNIHLVKATTVSDESAVSELLTRALSRGYEGIILRNAEGLYAAGQRSVDLQKLKDFVDDEFEIVDCVDGKGREDEAIIYVCKTKDGKQFAVRPQGSVPDRKTQWYNFCVGVYNPVGQMLTVRYQNLTDDGLPRFPVGVEVRNYE